MLALFALSSLTVASCESRTCNTIGCESGLTVTFTGATFDGGALGDTFDILLEQQIENHFAPLMTCSFTANTHVLLCSSQRTHREDQSTTLIAGTDFRTIRATVSAGGTQISQDVFELAWTSREVWGPGCGVCTQAAMTVALPAHS